MHGGHINIRGGMANWWYIGSIKLAVNACVTKSEGHTNSAKKTETMTRKGLQESSSWSNTKAYMTMGQQRRRLNLQAK